jgi:hypothetical protein
MTECDRGISDAVNIAICVDGQVFLAELANLSLYAF